MESYVRIVEPVPHPHPIPPVTRWSVNYGTAFKEAGGFSAYFQEADQEARILRALSRRQEKRRKELENGLYPIPMTGVEMGPCH